MARYVFCDDNCKHEGMTKEEIFALLAQAAEGKLEFDSESAFITKVKEKNTGSYITFWVGTQAQYNALGIIEKNCLYIISDETTKDDFEAAFRSIAKQFEDIAQHFDDVDTTLLQAEGIFATLNNEVDKKVAQVLEVLPNAETYTAQNAMFYNVSVAFGGFRVAAVTIDSSLLLNSDQGYDFHIASVDDDVVYVHAEKNSNGTVTFTAGSSDSTISPLIAHIAGFA